MALAAYLLHVEPFPKVDLEIHFFGIFNIDWEQSPNPAVTLVRQFFAIYCTKSHKYSCIRLPTPTAAFAWLSEVERMALEGERVKADEEQDTIRFQLMRDRELFASEDAADATKTERILIKESQSVLTNAPSFSFPSRGP